MKSTKYKAKKPDSEGFVRYTPTEDKTWATLYAHQSEIIKNRACDEYIKGLDILQLDPDKVPQLPDVNKNMMAATGWSVAPVAALISFDRFFDLLAHRKFPAATFIRIPEELEYLQEPDIFHEVYGHCPMLTDPTYADFMQAYGELGLKATDAERVMLARLYWFTVEFGLIRTAEGLKIYGGGILSSMGETVYALESDIPERRPFNTMTALRTPYRIDIFQTVYYVIENYKQLYDLMNQNLIEMIHESKNLGDFPPTYPAKEEIVANPC